MRSEMPGARRFEVSRSRLDDAVTVMLVDGRAVLREGLHAVIDGEPGLVVVAEATTVRGARSLDVTPDVIVTAIGGGVCRTGEPDVEVRLLRPAPGLAPQVFPVGVRHKTKGEGT